ncbi:MAG: hypothetical protein WC807_15390 [Hyphomicrobium sp.]|jgi:hypothetical protein|uniref:hypothetical protein n=1 Tax=Hyphomicrobium sp. DMF-1 TaxID=3019544 RepID=UPI000BCFA387|nr:hypothetical protein [Hyphomicrobium sp. DMF-1]OYW53672.1 MAG: hypothetical protein B7Z29_14560 [Hyphomicrobium sp. 12-62-95]OYX98407.1 MAG: hypothetical protein B7Y80_15335 [Hyphomicrobium sp. 32-62-53]WBT37923.1 hypothetical protein PE058_20040 [Hyphomicrobium sp. DMF-1]
MPITIGSPDGYWFALLEQRRIARVFHHDKIIARAFYAEQGPSTPSTIFNRIIERHRARAQALSHAPHSSIEHEI